MKGSEMVWKVGTGDAYQSLRGALHMHKALTERPTLELVVPFAEQPFVLVR
jgi:hypothetical protein